MNRAVDAKVALRAAKAIHSFAMTVQSARVSAPALADLKAGRLALWEARHGRRRWRQVPARVVPAETEDIARGHGEVAIVWLTVVRKATCATNGA